MTSSTGKTIAWAFMFLAFAIVFSYVILQDSITWLNILIVTLGLLGLGLVFVARMRWERRKG